VAFFQEIAPGTPWRVITHGSGCPKWGVTDAERLQPNGMTVAYLEMARRIAFAEPRVPGHPRTCNARDCLGGTDPFAFRSLTPSNVINAHYDGFCWKGLDYWSYSNPTGGVRSALNTDVGFGNIVGTTPRTIAWPGPTGAVATVQYEMLRAGIQDTEAAWHIWAVLDDPQRRAKLPPDLVNRAQTAIAELADMYETGLRGGPQGGNDVRGFVNRLHAVAAEVTAATGTQ
jgi:hypothetical protein